MRACMTALAVLLIGTGTAVGANMWGVHAAYWDTSDADSSYGAGTKFSFEMVPGARLDLRASYFNDLADDVDGIDTDLEVLPLELGLALVYPAARSIDLTAGGGIGYYFMDGKINLPDNTSAGADPGDEVGFYLAAGLEWSLRKSGASYGETEAGLFLEALYRSVSADDMKVDSVEPLRLGDADLDGLGVNLGIMVRW